MNGNGEMIDTALRLLKSGQTSTARHGYSVDLAKKQKVWWGVNPVFSRHLVTF